MLSVEINDILNYLKNKHPLIAEAKFYEDDVDGGFFGLTDLIQNYIYIRSATEDSPESYSIDRVEEEYGCKAFSVEADYWLIGDFEDCIDTRKVLFSLVADLVDYDLGGIQIEVTDAGDENEPIYTEQTGREDWKDNTHNLLKIGFTIRTIKTCQSAEILCREDCCY